jgi:hypothetical protein
MLRAFPLLTGLAFLAGCSGKAVDRLRDDADQLILYSIDGPSFFKNEGQLTPEQARGEVLHGYPVLGKVEITDPEQRRAVISAVKDAVRNNTEKPSTCFIPRHAIRAAKSGETVDLVICFQCRNYEGYRNGQRDGGTVGISSSAQELLNKTLTDVGVPLSPKD